MRKPAETQFPVQELIRERWSPLAFSPRQIPPEILGSLFEAARWAPSSFNDQPWSFCIATQDQPAEFAQLAECLVEGNRAWARHAYLLAISCARLDFSTRGKPNRHAYHDVGAATMNLLLQATAHGLITHPMAGFDLDRARTVLQIPATHDPVTALAIGYPADDLSQLDEGQQQRERGARARKPLSDVVFSGAWGRYAGPFA